jgi:hypothetical protein
MSSNRLDLMQIDEVAQRLITAAARIASRMEGSRA